MSGNDFNAYVGYSLNNWDVGTSYIELELKPHHLNSQGIVHGGVLMSLLDSACGAAGSTQPPPAPRAMSVTVSLTANFVKAMQGKLLRAYGEMTGGGRSIYFAQARVVDENDQLIASASGAFKRTRKLE
ncbi:PaaI family thioesterase [Sulfitobacter sp. F26169L]|uniref:PaaI family thioesterase n=1 Tax=Sulfitobacter sp. F26169L TaxID=2996015 RepID=UPI002260A519|nr:PaaI family thioesterase [Sulfitobacter sp. F26169L]MCX7568110.1 PaaI family thioesterase [Sulfitobacter sp. F26169L]